MAIKELRRMAFRWRPWILVVGLCGAPIARGDSQQAERSLEGSLLHRRLDLRGLEVWSVQAKQWQPLTVPNSRVLVINLWRRSCVPCLKEMPSLAVLSKAWLARREVQFLFVADPPDEMTRAAVEEFWLHPYVELPGQPCPGQASRLVSGSSRCGLTIPSQDPVRATNDDLARLLGTVTKPLTLLVDARGVVRQAFVGELSNRTRELGDGLERLLGTLASEKGGAAPPAKR